MERDPRDPSKPLAKGDARTPAERERQRDQDKSNVLGTHPVGTAVGGVAGAAVVGAAVGSAAGPIGAAVGAAIGAAAGGMTGKLVADLVDPQLEDAYWRKNWSSRHYIDGGFTYDQDYAPAYRYGVQSFMRQPERRFDEVESELSAGWGEARGESRLDWGSARHASQDAWLRAQELVERAAPGGIDRDGK